jgi:mRNA-degrading endonuclease toxin of MazEF toxin-antitoxin module
MHIERGQVISARFPHASGTRGKKRPVVVIQTDVYNRRLRHAVVAQLTTNLADKDDPACFLIELATPEGQAAGISQDSVFFWVPDFAHERGPAARGDRKAHG